MNNGVDELERRIADRLHGHSRRAPDNDGWEAISDRITARARARRRRRAAATGLVVAGMVGALVVELPGDVRTQVSTTPAGPAASVAGPVVGGLPRLVLDVPGFELSHASTSDDTDPFPDLGPLLVYGTPGDGLLGPGPVVFVRLVPAGASYGIGDGPEVQSVDVAGRPGRIFSTGVPNVFLGWPRADGSIVHLLGVGLRGDELVDAGGLIEEALAAGQAPPTTLPGGVELRRSTPADVSPSRQAEVDYRFEGGSVGFRLLTGRDYRLDNLLLDRLASSIAWQATTVDGKPAVLSTYQGSSGVGGSGRTLLWAVADGVVAELTAHGLTDAEIEAAAAAIHPVDEATWGELLARSAALDAPEGSTPDALDDGLTAELCQARNAWLKARAIGDGGVEAASLANLDTLLEKGKAGGLGDTGDILVVARRLLDAMAAGDDALVSSIPEGGACS